MTELPATAHIKLEAHGPVLRIWLNRPELRNAMSGQMVREILATFAAIGEDRGIRVVVLRGAGGSFCAGADLKNLASITETSPGRADPADCLHRRFLHRQLLILQGQAEGGDRHRGLARGRPR